MNFRIGFGFDVHRLEPAKNFWLGGILIPHDKGSVGHSDADTLIHAICDALLGAANLGDIGTHFPDTSDEFMGIDSKILLTKVVSLLKQKNYLIGNIDVTVCLENPKLTPFFPEMKQILAQLMNVDTDAVSLKATTNEKLGFIGREEGIAVYAVALIKQYKL